MNHTVPLSFYVATINFRGHGGVKQLQMKTCSRDLLQQMTENYETRVRDADEFRCALDLLFFAALRAARETDNLRKFDCFKEAERQLLRVAASSYLNGLMAGCAVCSPAPKPESMGGSNVRLHKKNGRYPS